MSLHHRFSIAFLTFLSCAGLLNAQPDEPVHIRGALKATHQPAGRAANVQLDTLLRSNNLMAVGPMANMTGEITCIAGKCYTATIDSSDTLQVQRVRKGGAAFLAWARVEDFVNIPLEGPIDNLDELEGRVESGLRSLGHDPAESVLPLVIQVKGAIADFHVLSPGGERGACHHPKQAFNAEGNGHLIGFYTQHHTRIITHHDTNLHLHFMNEEGTLMGHLDNLHLPEDAELILMLPDWPSNKPSGK